MRKTSRFEKIRGGKFFILLGAAEYVVFVKEIECKRVTISGPEGPYSASFETGTVDIVGYLSNKKESTMFRPLAASFDEKIGFGPKCNGITFSQF